MDRYRAKRFEDYYDQQFLRFDSGRRRCSRNAEEAWKGQETSPLSPGAKATEEAIATIIRTFCGGPVRSTAACVVTGSKIRSERKTATIRFQIIAITKFRI